MFNFLVLYRATIASKCLCSQLPIYFSLGKKRQYWQEDSRIVIPYRSESVTEFIIIQLSFISKQKSKSWIIDPKVFIDQVEEMLHISLYQAEFVYFCVRPV